jgi:hypothetical protein
MGIFGVGDTSRQNVMQNVKVYNNTFYELRGSNTGIYAGHTTDGGYGNEAYNNIWVNCDNPTIIGGEDNATWEINHDYNAFINCTGDFVPVETNGVYGTEDPFTNSASYVFSLVEGSQPIDNGTRATSSVVTDDFIGTSRPYNSVYDIGAYEYFTPPSVTFKGVILRNVRN